MDTTIITQGGVAKLVGPPLPATCRHLPTDPLLAFQRLREILSRECCEAIIIAENGDTLRDYLDELCYQTSRTPSHGVEAGVVLTLPQLESWLGTHHAWVVNHDARECRVMWRHPEDHDDVEIFFGETMRAVLVKLAKHLCVLDPWTAAELTK